MFGLQHGETVQHLAYTGQARDAHGNVKPTYAPPVAIHGVGVDIPDVDEPRDAASQRQIVDHVLFLPPGFTCSRKDKFIVRGDEYQVEGHAPTVPNFFTGTMFRTEVKVRAISG